MGEMNEARARAILGPELAPADLIAPERWKFERLPFGSWCPEQGAVSLDGTYAPDEIEAILWWVRNKS